MISSLEQAITLHQRFNIKDFVVSEKVFLQVLVHKNQLGEPQDCQMINVSYDSPCYRYMNRAWWRGMLFIYVSSTAISLTSQDLQ
jgi:hypothetical protein